MLYFFYTFVNIQVYVGIQPYKPADPNNPKETVVNIIVLNYNN